MMKNSKRHIWRRIVIVVAVLLCPGIWFSIRPPFWIYRELTMTTQEVPPRLARPAFSSMINEWDLPSKTENLRVIFNPGRNHAIFAVFQTTPKDTSYIQDQLVSLGYEFTPYSGHPLKSHFFIVSQWQERSEINIFDEQTFIESGFKLRYRQDYMVTVEIVLDTQHNKWYIFARET